jgi:putative ABC transport system permease protein
MDTLLPDLRHGFRMLVKNPGFTLVAVLTLALGIGANTAIFSVVNGVMLKPLPYPEPERLLNLRWQWRAGGWNDALTPIQAYFWRENSRVFESVAVMRWVGASLVGDAGPEQVVAMLVTHDFFRVFQIQPLLGRGIAPEEDTPGGPSAVVLSHRLWQRSFGGSPDILGRAIKLNGESSTVVGVMPPGFGFESSASVWLPLRLVADVREQGHNYLTVGRLKPGVTAAQAEADMVRVGAEFARAHPRLLTAEALGVRPHPYKELVVGGVREALLVLFGAVAFVLLIACANVANLFLARAAARQKEMAVRTTLGATSGRILRQLLAESLVFALVAGAAGLLLAIWGTDALLAASPVELPRLEEVSLDRNVLGFTLGVSVLIAVGFGLAAAGQARKGDLAQSLKESGQRTTASRERRRLPNALVVSEVALSLVLLAGASLLIATFANLRGVRLGFNPENLQTAELSLSAEKYKPAAASWEFKERVRGRLRSLPGVVSVASAASLPLVRGLNTVVFRGDPDERVLLIELRAVSPEYFETLGIPILRGRGFLPTDGKGGAPVALANETLARRIWKEKDPLGQTIAAGEQWPGPGPYTRQVIGIVPDVKDISPDSRVAPTLYVPEAQMLDGLNAAVNQWFLAAFLVRTAAPMNLSTAFRRAVAEVDAEQPVTRIRAMDQVMSASIAGQRFHMLLMGTFAGLALLLTAVGIYGVLSYRVAQRTHEIGVRMALGATARDVLRLVLGHGLLLAAVGVAIGLGASYGLTRFLRTFLFGVRPVEPLLFAGVALLLVAVALLACYLPARRATRVDPMVALRYE